MIPNNKSNQQRRTSSLSQSKRAGGENVYTNVFNATALGVRAGMQAGANQRQPQVGLSDRIKSEIKHDLENGVYDYNWTNIKSLPADKQSFITNSIRKNYYEKAQMSMIRNQMDPTDPNRGMLMMEEDMKKDFASNLNANLSQLEQLKSAYLQDEDGNAMSDLVPEETRGQILGMIRGELPMNIDASGNLIFGEGENAFTMKDAPSYFNKDFKSANAMLKSYESVYNAGKPLSAASKQMYMNDFHEMLNSGGDNSIMSLSFDNVMGMYDADGKPTSLLSKDQYANELNALQRGTPEEKEAARQTLKQALTQSYMTSLDTQAQAGFDAKQPKTNTNIETGGYTGRELYQYSNFKSTVDLFKGLNEDNSNAANKISAIMPREFQGRIKFNKDQNAILVDSNLKDPNVYDSDIYRLNNETDLRRFLMLMGVPNYMISQNPDLLNIFPKQENTNVNTQPGSIEPMNFDQILADIDKQEATEEAKKQELRKKSFENFQKNLMKERENVASTTYVAPRKPIIPNIPKTYK